MGSEDLSVNPAAAYDAVLVPRVFEPWARVLLDAVHVEPDQVILDLATGPGTVARLVAQGVVPRGRVVASDLNPAMLDVAKSKSGGAAVQYLRAMAAPLPLASQEFDLVLCHHGLQFFPDRPAAMAEARRILKPGGRLAVATWADNGPIPLGSLGRQLAASGVTTPVPPAFGRDPAEVIHLLLEAGFRDVRAEQRTLTITWPGGMAEMLDRALPATVGPLLASLTSEQRQEAVAAFRQDVARFVSGGAVSYPSAANIVWARS